jgi:hypothetical protein
MKSAIQGLQRWVGCCVIASGLVAGGNLKAAEIVLPTGTLNGASMAEIIRTHVGVFGAELGFEPPAGPGFYAAPNGTVALSPIVYSTGTFTFNFNLTQGTPLLVNSLVYVTYLDNNQNNDAPPCNTAINRFTCGQVVLRELVDSVLPTTTLILKIDGESVVVGNNMRTDSNSISVVINLPSEDAFGTPPGDYNVLFDGWFTGITGLSLGMHTIEYGFRFPDREVIQIAQVNVVPVPLPASAFLVLLGLPVIFRKSLFTLRRSLS